jgi:hypothetical protein
MSEQEKNAQRFEFLCDCKDDATLDCLAEELGNRKGLIALIDALIAERSKKD